MCRTRKWRNEDAFYSLDNSTVNTSAVLKHTYRVYIPVSLAGLVSLKHFFFKFVYVYKCECVCLFVCMLGSASESCSGIMASVVKRRTGWGYSRKTKWPLGVTRRKTSPPPP